MLVTPARCDVPDRAAGFGFCLFRRDPDIVQGTCVKARKRLPLASCGVEGCDMVKDTRERERRAEEAGDGAGGHGAGFLNSDGFSFGDQFP